MRVFVTGDIHGKLEASRLLPTNFPQGKNLTKDDYVIVAGDFGIVWNYGVEQMQWLEWFDSRPWTTLFVDGNHENHPALAALPVESWHGGKIHHVSPSIIHLMRGQIFDFDGRSVFTMGGADSVDKDSRIEGVSWWPEEMPSQQEYDEALASLERVNWKVDYVITHCCATSVLPAVYPDGFVRHGQDELTDWLDTIEHRLLYKQWYFGHHHKDVIIPPDHRLLYHDIVRLGQVEDVDMSNPLLRDR